MAADDFAARVLAWWVASGRKDLPWQQDVSPYRVWISEIMLQQTQVTTVLPFYQRFMARFPDVAALARAPLDEVLHHWSGLGYYARARNLHAAANLVCERFDGELPLDMPALMSLPGIGRSTAGAILALAHGQREAILDGNVKRVLARYFAVNGQPGQSDTLRRLWALSDSLVPRRDVAAYTQAMMDLGATVCTRSRPDCASCPLEQVCEAHASGREAELPARRPRRLRPLRRTRMLVAVDADGAVLLERRPPQGIWGGLWGLPEIDDGCDVMAWCDTRLRGVAESVEELPPLKHGFTHFELDIRPALVRLKRMSVQDLERDDWLWYNKASPVKLGLAAPVARLLSQVPGTGTPFQEAGGQGSRKGVPLPGT
ncbi:MAG: A/G-specific adenine glycosylase [Gammaproteobacteria bacterium]|nr:A/G-specific adenine glycosylase [Gammaproteobacteria bacterium]